MGGLGNQLFQIFTTIDYAIQVGNPFKFTNAKQLGSGSSTIRRTYWDSFLKRLAPFTTGHFSPNVQVVKENSFAFQQLTVIPHQDTLLFGYFQSYKYFESNVAMIYRIIGLENARKEVLAKLKCRSMQDFKDTISLHFRLGDYKHVQHCHPILSKSYYEKSIQTIQTNQMDETRSMRVMFFCEDEDLDEVMLTIHHLSKTFPTYFFVRGDNMLEDWEQMLLMSCCHHNVIANSSFSWWAAYFNAWEDKIVCYPSVWFGPTLKHDTSDLCPPTWTRVVCE